MKMETEKLTTGHTFSTQSVGNAASGDVEVTWNIEKLNDIRQFSVGECHVQLPETTVFGGRRSVALTPGQSTVLVNGLYKIVVKRTI